MIQIEMVIQMPLQAPIQEDTLPSSDPRGCYAQTTVQLCSLITHSSSQKPFQLSQTLKKYINTLFSTFLVSINILWQLKTRTQISYGIIHEKMLKNHHHYQRIYCNNIFKWRYQRVKQHITGSYLDVLKCPKVT